MSSRKKVRIEDFLTRVKSPVKIERDKSYKRVTIRMYHKGVYLRDIVDGSSIHTKTLYKVLPGQFILSGIDARNAAFGIIPEDLDGAVVSNDFWVFDIDQNIIDIDYFYWLTTTNQFLNICKKSSLGTTNRQRLQSRLFYNFEIDLPPISIQRKVVSKITKTVDLNNKFELEIFDQRESVLVLKQAILSEGLLGEFLSPSLIKHRDWKQVLIKDVCQSIIDCVNKTAPVVNNITPYKMIRTSNIKMGMIDLDNVKYVTKETYEKWTRRGVPTIGDLILTREAPLGQVALVTTDDNIFLGQRLVQYRVDPKLLYNKYLFYLFQSSILQTQMNNLSSGSTVKHLRVPDCEKFIIPLPTLEEQKVIISHIEKVLSSCNQIEDTIKESLRYSALLKQSIMQEAFQRGVAAI